MAASYVQPLNAACRTLEFNMSELPIFAMGKLDGQKMNHITKSRIELEQLQQNPHNSPLIKYLLKSAIIHFQKLGAFNRSTHLDEIKSFIEEAESYEAKLAANLDQNSQYAYTIAKFCDLVSLHILLRYNPVGKFMNKPSEEDELSNGQSTNKLSEEYELSNREWQCPHFFGGLNWPNMTPTVACAYIERHFSRILEYVDPRDPVRSKKMALRLVAFGILRNEM